MTETAVPTVPTSEEEIIGTIDLTPVENFPMKVLSRSKKGSAGAEKYSLVRVVIPLNRIVNLLSSKLNEAGNQVFENWLVREGINPACNEATAEAWDETEDGKVKLDAEKFVTTFWDYFVPSDRRKGGGVTIKDLTERLRAVTPEFTKAIEAHTAAEQSYMGALENALKVKGPTPNKAQFVSDEVQNRVRQLLLEVTELNAAIEKRSRPAGTGRPKGSKNKKAEVVAPLAQAA